MNKMKHIGMVLLVGTMFLGFSVGLASADNLSDIVFNDGHVINAPDIIDGAELLSAAPFEGGEFPTEQELISAGVSLAPVDLEMIANLKPAPSGIEDEDGESMEAVLGVDTRMNHYTNYYPARAVVMIEIDESLLCTGWLTGNNTVITAGHCVHTGGSGGSWRSPADMRVYPGFDVSADTPDPYGSCTVSMLGSVIGWTQQGKEEYDYGAIRLNCIIGDTTGWFGFTSKGKKKDPARITGYPGDQVNGEQWESADHVRARKSKQIFYYNDTAGGMSGSPVWYDSGPTGGPTAIGIHAYRTHGSGVHAKYNHGTRINKSVYNNIWYWRNTW